MTKVLPVSGRVVKQSFAQKVVSPAYDALTPEERAQYVALNPLNFLSTMRSINEYPVYEAPTEEQLLKHNAENLQSLISQQVFERIDEPSFFIYRLEIDEHVQTGLVAEMPIQEYSENRILIHENTRSQREQQLTNYLFEVGASSSPVCLAYPENTALTQMIADHCRLEPMINFTSEDGLRQTLWKIDNRKSIENIQAAFSDIEKVYLTDGHHRCASGLNFANQIKQEENHDHDPTFTNLLAIIFPDNEMRILAYHRCVRDIGDMSVHEFLQKLDEFFHVEHLHVNYPDEAEPRCKGEFAMLLDEYWYRLIIRAEYKTFDDPVESLDVSILEKNLLSPILGIEDMRGDPRLDYVPGGSGLRALEERAQEGWRLMLGCYPTSIKEMYAVADNKRVMPPKSTWFDPKVRSGIFLKRRLVDK